MDIGTLTGQIEIEDQLSSKLTMITAKVKQFAENFEGALGALAIGTGVVVTGLTAITGAVTALGVKGSTILGVENAFNDLSASIGQTGETLLGKLNDGVKGTVDSFDLMRSSNRMLGAGVKLTGDDMLLMGQMARELGKSTGGDATSGFDTLSTAMVRGNARALTAVGLTVNLDEAEKKFALSIGTTKDQLTSAGLLEAKRIGLLDAMRERLDKTGVSEMSFKETILAGKVAISDWFDTLAKSVASSTSVNSALDAIGKAFADVFGESSKKAIETITGWIDSFAKRVESAVPYVKSMVEGIKDFWTNLLALNERFGITDKIVEGAKATWKFLSDAFDLVRTAVDNVIEGWKSMPEWLQKISINAVKLGAGLYVTSAAMTTVATPLASFITKLDTGINVLGNFTGALASTHILFPKLGIGMDGVSLAYSRLMASIASNSIVMAANELLIKASLQSTVVWKIGQYALGETVLATSIKTAAATAMTVLNTAATKLATASQGLFAAALALVNSNSLVMGVRMGLASVATKIAGNSATIASYGFFALGTAVALASKALAVFVGWQIGQAIGEWINKMTGADVVVGRLAARFGEWIGYLSKGTVAQYDLNESTKAMAGAYDAALEAHKRLKDELSGLADATKVKELSAAFLELSPAVQASVTAMNKTGAAALSLREQGAILTPELSKLADRWKALQAVAGEGLGSGVEDDFVKVRDAAIEMQQAIKGLTDSVTVSNEQYEVQAKALEASVKQYGFSKEVIAAYLPFIEKQVSLGLQLTQTQATLFDASRAKQQADIARGQTELWLLGVTNDTIIAMRALGKSDADMARQWGVSEAAIKSYGSGLSGLKGIMQELDDLENTLRMSAREKRIEDINRKINERQAAIKTTEEDAQAQFSKLEELRKKQIDAEIIDIGGLKAVRLSVGQEIAATEKARYELMTSQGTNVWSAAAIDAQRKVAEVARVAALDIAGNYNDAMNGMVAGTQKAVGEIAATLGTLDNPQQIGGNHIYTNADFAKKFKAPTPRASGGPVTDGKHYRVGEVGPEDFIPTQSGTIVPAGGGGKSTIIINAQNSFFDNPDSMNKMGRYVEDALAKRQSGNDKFSRR